MGGNVQDSSSPSHICVFSEFGNPIRHFRKYHDNLCGPPKTFCITTVFSFSWNDSKSQEKLKTMVMQNFEVDKKIIMVFSEVANRNNFLSFFSLWQVSRRQYYPYKQHRHLLELGIRRRHSALWFFPRISSVVQSNLCDWRLHIEHGNRW